MAISRIQTTLLCALLLMAPHVTTVVAEQRPTCSCAFKPSTGTEAHGVKDACNVTQYRSPESGRNVCNISFAGHGAQERVLVFLGLDPAAHDKQANALTAQHIMALAGRDIGLLQDPGFLREALPLYLKAALPAPEQAQQLDIDVRLLDATVSKAFPDIAGQVADAFREPGASFNMELDNDIVLLANFGTITIRMRDRLRMDFIFFRREQ